MHPWLAASHHQGPAPRSGPIHQRDPTPNTSETHSSWVQQPSLTSYQAGPTLPASTLKENKHIPAKWLKIPRELVRKILEFDVYKVITI